MSHPLSRWRLALARRVHLGPRSHRVRTMSTALTHDFHRHSEVIHRLAMQSLFERLDSLCEGAIAVDKQARIVWINSKYVSRLGLSSVEEALGRDIETVIPNSLMRQVVQSGEPILQDIMDFGNQSFVVTRMPLQDDAGRVIGAIGFVI